MPKAVGDKAVVPIIYEGRESEFQNTEAVDKWFDRITADLNPEQKADLKRKFKSADPLYESESRMQEVAYDISQHFDKHFKGTKLKGQFATSSKRAAITYKKLLDGWGKVRSAVIISPPDTREDNDSVNEADISEVQRFWKDTIALHGHKYEENTIRRFNWQHHKDIQNRMMNEIDDLVHDLKKTHDLFILWGDLDQLIAKILKIAENYEVN